MRAGAAQDQNARQPNPLAWRGESLCQRRVANYYPDSFVDGEGVRCSLYVSGCPFKCEGCFNAATWSFRYGTEYTDELQDRILTDLSRPWVQGLSLLGGEPMLATPILLPLLRAFRKRFGAARDVWCWTGYRFEELIGSGHKDKLELLGLIDVLVDGRFEIAQKAANLAFRGSRNQRILRVPASLAAGRAVEYGAAYLSDNESNAALQTTQAAADSTRNRWAV